MSIFKSIKKNFSLILYLTKNDFKKRFAGSYLGIFWAFVQPIITILLYWFVFQVGLKAGGQDEYPFILWLMCGLIPWFFFSESLTSATFCFIEYSYLVKKVVFDIEILPLIKILSAMIVHLFFIVLLFIVMALYGYLPTMASLQFIYYTICMIVLVFGITYLTSSLNIFFNDLSQIVNVFIQVGMWMTPIMWNYQVMNFGGILGFIFKLNPMFYIVQGYRSALLDGQWFFASMPETIYFWVFALGMLVVGLNVFKKMRPHFADAL